jgi:hypothetical protein
MGKKIPKPEWVVHDHEIHGVTPDMIDWWWINMDKGYPLWHPEDHKSFVWEVPPEPGTVLGGIAKVEQAPARKPGGRPGRVDPDSLPQDIKDWITYDHVVAYGHLSPDNKLVFDMTHEYEAASYGTRHRMTIYSQRPMPAEPARTGPAHVDVEAKRWEEFLPELYKMWQVVKDPAINRQCCCKIKKEGSTIRYIR